VCKLVQASCTHAASVSAFSFLVCGQLSGLVAASEVRICQVRAPFWVLLPQEILCAAVVRRATRNGKPETV